jgi:antitoxin ParD1/3/4
MATLNVSLPKSMKTFVDSQVQQSGYSTASEYIRELIRDAQKRAGQQKLEELLLEGLDSGPSIRIDSEFWQRRERLVQNLRGKKSRK